MADEIDLASVQAELFLAQALAARVVTPRLPCKGKCYNCDTVFEEVKKNKEGVSVDENDTPIADKLFCDKDCADDYTKRERMRTR